MDSDSTIKQQVTDFYNQVGWQKVSDGVYQNARYEDLRPVAREYVHRCHLRVGRWLNPMGRYLLDAGSGPIQYPEYLTYSQDYAYRVCVDISIVALREARQRIGDHGMFVVADIANLPFKQDVFDGVVSLHTIHHLPAQDHLRAYEELYRVLGVGHQAVIVNGWTESRLMRQLSGWMKFCERVIGWVNRLQGRTPQTENKIVQAKEAAEAKPPQGTFVTKHDVAWLKHELNQRMPFDIYVWRSVSVRFLRAVFHPLLGGKFFLRLLYAIEERYPKYFGENGQYPLIVIRKMSSNRKV
jgi:ubiquinone/menaquinone biosynthesis C-methylase UbiE